MFEDQLANEKSKSIMNIRFEKNEEEGNNNQNNLIITPIDKKKILNKNFLLSSKYKRD